MYNKSGEPCGRQVTMQGFFYVCLCLRQNMYKQSLYMMFPSEYTNQLAIIVHIQISLKRYFNIMSAIIEFIAETSFPVHTEIAITK